MRGDALWKKHGKCKPAVGRRVELFLSKQSYWKFKNTDIVITKHKEEITVPRS